MCVYSVVTRYHVNYKFIGQGKWPISGTQVPSKESLLGCLSNAVLARKASVKKTTVTALGQVSNAANNVSAWIVKTEDILRASLSTIG